MKAYQMVLPKGATARSPLRLVQREVEVPEPGPGEVLVRVEASGVCHRELIDLNGGHPAPNALPLTAGHEFAGVIEKIGRDDECHPPPSWLHVGARVVNLFNAQCGQCRICLHPRRQSTRWCEQSDDYFGTSVDGSHAHYVRSKVNALVPLPEAISFVEGCFLMCTAGVALRGLQYHADLQQGERLLITGATGGVGIHAIQLAKKMFGATVVTITSSQDKVSILHQYGADEVIVCQTKEELEQFHRRIRPVDVVLECVGTPTLGASIRSLRLGGRLVIVGNVSATKMMFNPGLLILKELKLFGSNGASRKELEQVLEMTAQGRLKPVVHSVMPLEMIHQAHRLLTERGVVGRIVLVPSHNRAFKL